MFLPENMSHLRLYEKKNLTREKSRAANQLWPDKIQEHLCVDISVEMNDLSELIIGQSEPQIKGVMYRQYLPISHVSRSKNN